MAFYVYLRNTQENMQHMRDHSMQFSFDMVYEEPLFIVVNTSNLHCFYKDRLSSGVPLVPFDVLNTLLVIPTPEAQMLYLEAEGYYKPFTSEEYPNDTFYEATNPHSLQSNSTKP